MGFSWSSLSQILRMTNPRNDRIFKQIFHHHPRSLMHLLNAFLPLQDPIVEVE